jgi:NADPH-dependent glutamate synthase beta subunit-like oxidoreductase
VPLSAAEGKLCRESGLAMSEPCPLAPIDVIGGGLAGSEAAWQIARQNVSVVLHEMRPARATPAQGGSSGRISE